jgi:hypothetical protein
MDIEDLHVLSEELSNELINDGVQFKIYAAEYELDDLKRLEEVGQPWLPLRIYLE